MSKLKNDHLIGCDEVKNSDPIIVKYRQNLYDITRFVSKHPGGTTTLRGLQNADMTSRFMKAPPHSDAAMYLLKEYLIKSKRSKFNDKVSAQEDSGIELIEEEEYNNNSNFDDSMEHLVDWSKAMLPQIPKITKYYHEWVHKPVDRPLRLFTPWYLEMCTKTPWWVIPTFWVPMIFMCVKHDFLSCWQNTDSRVSQLSSFVVYFLLGILFWTFLEYTLHRWVFHVRTTDKTHPWLCAFHFMIHGLHHKVPFDEKRLVFPPVPGAIIATVIYTPLSYVLTYPRIILGGALFGYLCYDLMHYYLHYGNPSTKHMYHMKRYHYQHHFAHQDSGYGISSPLWDFIFNTQIRLRKLRFQLRWN